MFKHISVILMITYIALINSAVLSDKISTDKSEQLLQTIRNAAAQKVSIFDNSITRWLSEVKEGQAKYSEKPDAELSHYKTYADRAGSLRKRAWNKETVKCCTENIEKMEEKKQYTEAYQGCVNQIQIAVSRNLGEVKRQISWILDEIDQLEGKDKSCKDDQKCLSNLNEELKSAVTVIPAKIQKKIDWAEDYCNNAAGKGNKACDSYWTDFQSVMSKLVKQVEECVKP